MTFDHIPVEQRGMARPGTLGNSMLLFEFGQLRILCEIDAGSKILQVPDPPGAAPSVRCLMQVQTEPRQFQIACFDCRTKCRGRGTSPARSEAQR